MTMERKAKTRLTTALVLLLVLAAGGVLGAALDRQLGVRTVSGEELGLPGGTARSDRRGGESGDRERSDTSERRRPLLVEQVGLTESQKTQVDSVVAYYRLQMRNLHEEFNEAYMTRYREIVETTRDELRALLSEEQRMAYDSLLVESDARRNQRREDSATSSRVRGNDPAAGEGPRDH